MRLAPGNVRSAPGLPPPVGSEDQRAFAKRYRMGDLDWIPSSASLCPDPFQEHVLVWHPPMVPTPWGAFERVSEELARSAGHPLSSAISNRLVRALGVVERQHTAAMQGHDLCMAPCGWCGQFVESCCDGVPASTSSRGWLCEFRVCRLCRSLHGRCRQCCFWTGLPAIAGGSRRGRPSVPPGGALAVRIAAVAPSAALAEVPCRRGPCSR